MTRFLFVALALGLACGESAPALDFPPDELDMLDPTPDPSCTGTWTVGARGRVVDEAGNGVAGARPQMCLRLEDGTLLCLVPPETDADGYFHQPFSSEVPGEEPRCLSSVAIRVLLPGEPFATTYQHLELRPNGAILEIDQAITLYDVPPTALPPEGDRSAPRDVAFDDGLVLTVTPEAMIGSYDRLSARRQSGATPAFAAGTDLLGLYAFTPEASVSPGFPIQIPNRHGLAEGAQVELLLLGGLETFLADGTMVPEADFEVFGTATVRGEMIVSDPGSELPYLTWLGYRRR